MAHLATTDDELEATLILGYGERLTPEAARAFLAEHGVRAGVLEAAIAAFEGLAGPASLVVAKGTPPRHGDDAVIRYAFRSGPQDLSPTIRPDGTADFRDLGAVAHAAPGTVLATRVPPTAGTDGVTVRGRALKGKPGYDRRLRAGDGAAVTPDGLSLVATREGNPHLRGEVVVVAPEYTVPSSVSLATGNVVYDGDLVIMGHVELQMEVRATGSVWIRGNVEGARVAAGGSITVDGGVRHQAQLEAGVDVIAKYVENSSIRCAGSLAVHENLVHGQVRAGGAVVAGEAICGGELHAGVRVEARTLGARLGTPTGIAVVPPEPHQEELARIKEELEAVRTNLQRISPKIREAQEAIAAGGVDMTVFRKVLELASQLAEREAALDLHALREATPTVRGMVVVREQAHPGVRVQIGIGHLTVKDGLPASTLVEERGHVTILAYVPAAEPLEAQRAQTA